MKKITLSLFFFTLASCGVKKQAAKDLFIGVYEITVFDVDQIGDIPLTLTLNKSNTEYTSTIEGRAEAADSEYAWEVNSTSIENDIINIEAFVASYDVYFELSIDGDEISGSLMGMYDVEGTRVNTP